MSIPKVIHFCWFGRGEKSDLIKKCMASWRRVAPDYQIVEWNEDNFDVNAYPYCKEAYEQKKYAFVADVARFHILYENGGIYMDTDVRMLRRLDGFLDKRLFMGFERTGLLNPGLIIGCEKGHEAAAYMLEFYKKHHFLLKNGRPDMTTVCTIMTDIMTEKGLIADGRSTDDERMSVYPVEYFDPYDYEHRKMYRTENTYTVHYYAMSWKSEKDMKIYKVGRAIKRITGPKLYKKIAAVKHRLLG